MLVHKVDKNCAASETMFSNQVVIDCAVSDPMLLGNRQAINCARLCWVTRLTVTMQCYVR